MEDGRWKMEFFMQNNISKADLIKIHAMLPEIQDSVVKPFFNDLLFNLNDLKNGSNYSVALVCLSDAYSRLSASKIALRNAYTQKIWYQELSPDAPHEIEAIFFSKFYLDYVPLLLYAMQEDVADFIVNFMNEEI